MAEENRSIGAGSGKNRAYFVEVRGVLPQAFQHPNGFLVTKDWTRVPIEVKHCDIHNKNYHSGIVGDIPVRNLSALSGGVEDHLNLLDFDAAYTLACLVQTQADSWKGRSLICRLVEVEVEYSWSTKIIGASKEISLFELRRDVQCELPEEGEKNERTKGTRPCSLRSSAR
jgi:hypothetical protein